jgi:hypothetical protein
MIPTVEFVIACCPAAKVFDAIEKAFHEVAGRFGDVYQVECQQDLGGCPT